MPAVSVIIPFYNVEPYIRRCLDTVVTQTFKDFEIICVDDGSTDNSGAIANEYAKKYPKLFKKVIHKKNGGSSSARNMAMRYVKSKYTMFVDADDFVAQNMIEGMYNFAESHNSDVAICDMLKGEKGKKEIRVIRYKYLKNKYKDSTFNAENVDAYAVRSIFVGPVIKIYSTELINNIKFPPVIIYEDVSYWFEVFSKAKRVNYLPVPYYFNVINREGSNTMSKDRRVFDVFEVFTLSEKSWREAGLFEKFQDNHHLLFSSYLMCAMKKLDPELRKEFVKDIKNYDMNMNYERLFNGKYHRYEKEDVYLIKLIKESNYKTVEKFCYEKKIWTK